jgi:hypothetical protein
VSEAALTATANTSNRIHRPGPRWARITARLFLLASACGGVHAQQAEGAQEARQVPQAPDPAPQAPEPTAAAGGLAASYSGVIRLGVATSDRLLSETESVRVASYSLRGRWAWGSVAAARLAATLGTRRQAGYGPLAIVPVALLELRKGPLAVSLGRQKVAWGRADGLNPTSRMDPRNYTRISVEDEEQSRGIDALRMDLGLGVGSLQVVLEHGFRASVIPWRERPGVELDRTRRGPDLTGRGLRYDIEGGTVDGGISWYEGRDRLPDLTPLAVSAGGVRVGQVYPAIRMLGVDAATSAAGWAWRGEFAYVRAPDASGTQPFVRNPELFGIVGMERNIGQDTSLYLQAFHKHVYAFKSPDALQDPRTAALAAAAGAVVDQTRRNRQGLIAKITKRWSDAWESDLTVLVAWPQHDFVLRPRIAYRPDDRWRWVFSADLFRGPETSTFGQLQRNSNAMLSVELIH